LQSLREKCYIDREGVSLNGISEAAENIGFRTLDIKIPFSDNFGILDFIVDQSNNIYFLEVNSIGDISFNSKSCNNSVLNN